MSTMASQFTSLTNVYSTVYSGADQRKHQSSALLAFVREIHRGPVNSPHKWPETRKMSPFDDVSMVLTTGHVISVTTFFPYQRYYNRSNRLCCFFALSVNNTRRAHVQSQVAQCLLQVAGLINMPWQESVIFLEPLITNVGSRIQTHDDVITWKIFRITGPL